MPACLECSLAVSDRRSSRDEMKFKDKLHVLLTPIGANYVVSRQFVQSILFSHRAFLLQNHPFLTLFISYDLLVL